MADWKVLYQGQEIDNVIDIRINRAINADTSSAEILISNVADNAVLDGLPIYETGVNLVIYASQGIVDTSNIDHRIGTYTILNHELSPNDKTIKLTCSDKTYEMLSRIFIGDETNTVDELVKLVVSRVNQTGLTQTPTVLNVASTRSDGSAFPTETIVSSTKKAYDIMLDLSSTGYTGDNRPYIFYFDESGEFHWVYPGNTSIADIKYEQSDVYEMKISKPESEIVTMIIYDAGKDKNDNSILGFYLKPDAGSIEGRMMYQPMTKIAEEFRQAFQNAGTYDSMTNDEFVTICENRALGRAEAIVYNWAGGLWDATIDTRGKRYSIGGLYTVESPSDGFPATKMRLANIVHTMNKNGWDTRLKMEQDPEELTNI